MPEDAGDVGICAALLNVTVLNPSTTGSISIWSYHDAWDGAATISYATHQSRQRMLMVGVGSDVQVRNNSNAPITLIVDVDGWQGCGVPW